MNNWFSRLAILAVIVLVAAVPLAAHMKIEKTAPAANSTVTTAPTTIQVWFTEAPDVKVSRLELRGASGPVALTGLHVMGEKSLMATVSGTMTAGAYTLSWQSAGNDGHVQKGQFSFTLKAAAG
jgi:methionine-rich copper-binding protein CopC